MNRKIKDTKYRAFWLIGTFLAFILYFSGIVWLYTYIQKKFFKKYRTIILTYHRVRNDSKFPDISVSTEKFKRQIAYLKKYFNVISLKTLINNIEEKKELFMESVAITFDDGYKDNFLNAYPVLKNYNLPATIFLITEVIGKNKEMIDVDEIKIMKNGGFDFESHTVTHRVLTELDFAAVFEEISQSRVNLENRLDETIRFFAYPKGKRDHFNKYIKTQVEKSGYKAAFTTINGQIDKRSDLFELPRLGIRNCPFFVFKVRVSGIFESLPLYSIRNFLRLT